MTPGKSPLTTPSSEALARFVIAWLLGRGGFDEWWGGIELSDQEEILSSLTSALEEWRAE